MHYLKKKEDVDVVTRNEEDYQPETVPKFKPRRNALPKKKVQKRSFSTKSEQANKKKNTIQNLRETKVRKVKNSVKIPQFSATSSPTQSDTSSSDNEALSKTDIHNQLERMRRRDLQNNFENLRLCIPSLRKSSKVTKVRILERAAKLIKNNEELKYERQRNIELKEKLRLLSLKYKM